MNHRVWSLMPWARGITFLLCAMSLFFLMLYGAMFIQHAVAVVRFPYQVDYGEGLELYQVSRLLTGQPLYSDINQPPYHLGVYGPLYPIIVAPIAALVGIGYGAGRAVSVVLALVIAWLLGKMVYNETRKLWVGIATGLLWLASHYVCSWAVLMRMDMLAVALSLLGLYVFWRGYICRSLERYVLIAMVLFVAAVYCRQLAIWAAAACLTYLVTTRRWTLVGKALVLYAGLGLALLGLLQAATGGEAIRHLFLYNGRAWQISRWQVALRDAWAMYPLAILASLVTLVLALLKRRPALPALYLAFAWLSSVTIAGAGGYINHLLEANAATWLASGLFVGQIAKSKRWPWPLIVSMALLIQVVMLVHLPYSLQSGVLPPWTAIKPAVRLWAKQNRAAYLWTPAPADARVADELSQRVYQTPGLILSEDGSFTTTHGRPMWIQFFAFTQLARLGLWDQSPFIEQIRSRQFALLLFQFDSATDVLSYRDNVTAEMLEAIRENYVLERRIWFYYVYVPRPQ